MATIHSLKVALEHLREKTKGPTAVAMQTGGVVVSAGLMGYVNGRYGDSSGALKLFQKIPVDLTVGVLAHLVGLSPYGGKYAKHLHDVGDGAIAAFGYRTGQAFGAKARTGPTASTQGTLSGYTPYQMGPAQAGLSAFTSQWANAHG